MFQALNKRRILHFIPSKKTPYITYTQRREDGSRIIIPPMVYEERKEQFSERINQVIRYAKNHHVCRSRMLLQYFGETRSSDCGICDVCADFAPAPQSLKTANERILDLLNDHQKHHISELHHLNIEEKALSQALEHLIHEELIHIDGAFLTL